MVMRRARSPVLQKPRHRTQSDAFANAKTNVGIIGPFEGSKPRQILISREDWQEMKLRRTMPLDKQQ